MLFEFYFRIVFIEKTYKHNFTFLCTIGINMTIKLVVDMREREFMEACAVPLSKYPHITMEVANLSLGDFEIYHNDVKLLIWERKSLTDLLQSIKDGRYKEQCHRLLHEYSQKQIVYLVEGILAHIPPDDRPLILSAMTSIAFFKGVHVWRTVHIQDTVDQLLACCDKIHREYEKGNYFEKPVETKSYTNFVKKEKRENITRENIGEIFLKQIPGISNTTASVLMEKAGGDFTRLMQYVKEEPEELASLYIGKRRIAQNVIAQLKTFLA